MVSTTDSAYVETQGPPSVGGDIPGARILRRAGFFLGLLVVFAGVLGLVGLYFRIALFASLFPGYKPIAFLAAVIWIFFGSVIAINAIRPIGGVARAGIVILTVLVAFVGSIEFPLNVIGKHFDIETLFVQMGDIFSGGPTTHISPVAAGLMIPTAIAIFLMLLTRTGSATERRSRDIVSITGISITLVSFTFVLSYLIGAPLLYQTQIIPIAFMSALAGVFTGLALAASAGPSAVPVVYFIGEKTRARLLRTFIPLTLFIIFAQIGVEISYVSGHIIPGAILVAGVIVVFSILMSYLVARASSSIGSDLDNARHKQQEAEEELRSKHSELHAAYEQLTATEEELRQNYEMVTESEEELRQNYEELTASQHKLRKSEEQYRALFENMFEGYAYCRMLYDEKDHPEDFIYIDVNRAFDEITGTKTVTGKRVTEVFPGIREVYPQLFELYGRVSQTGVPESFDLDFLPVNKWLHISVYSPEKGYFIAIFEDITVKKQADAQREAFIRELEQKNSELERFTYTVSHDLKSPLITIKGFLGMLEEDALHGDIPQLKSDIVRISSATDKMQALLTDLLTLSRIGRIANPPEKVSFNVLATEAVEQVAGTIRDRGVTVTIPPDLPAVFVDRVRIREVLVNLLENAVKFMGNQENPAITIGVRNGSGQTFFVQDNGIGIEPQYVKKIFGLFEKLDAKSEGTGVGLTIVQRIIEVHGGKIWAESAGPGRGTTFCFTLPIAE